MPNYSSLATTLEAALNLEYPPVALAPVTHVPDGIPVYSGVVPSACSFWRIAERETFVARDTDHMNCPVGALTMGFTLTPEAKTGLDRGLAMMCEVGYLNPEEAAYLPSLQQTGSMMLYGPLIDFPVDPKIVLVWVQPAQAMILQEATGDAQWKAEPVSGVFGRPSCAALAVAAREGNVALSFGCTGMRTFTEIEPAYMLAALSERLLSDLEANLKRTDKANCIMQNYYIEQKSHLR